MDVLSAGQLKFFAGYGLRVSFVIRPADKLEYFLNTPSSWTPIPQRANSRLVWDDTGAYSALLANSRRTRVSRHALDSHAADALHDLLLEAIDVRKHARRQAIWPLQYRLACLRRQLAAFALSTERLDDALDVQASMKTVDALPTRYLALLRRSLSARDAGEAAFALDSLRLLAQQVALARGGTEATDWALLDGVLSEARDDLYARAPG